MECVGGWRRFETGCIDTWTYDDADGRTAFAIHKYRGEYVTWAYNPCTRIGAYPSLERAKVAAGHGDSQMNLLFADYGG